MPLNRGEHGNPKERHLIRQIFVKVAGNDLPKEVMDQLYEVQLDNSLHLPDMCTLRLHDPDAKYTNEKLFKLGAELTVEAGDEEDRHKEKIFDGELIGIVPEYRDGTIVDLTVRGYDRSHRLHRGAQAKAYLNMSDSDIASKIASDHGLTPDVDSSSPVHDHVYLDGQTHMEFLRDRARRIGYEAYVREKTLCFKKAETRSGSAVKLEFGKELRSFRPILSLGEQINEVRVKGWDVSQKKEIIGKATKGKGMPEIGQEGPGGDVAKKAFGDDASELTVLARVKNQAEADTVAQAVLDQHSGAFVEAEGLCYGNYDIKPGSKVELSALGKRFNGKYRVTQVTHIWDTGSDYLTRFTVSGRRAETMRELVMGEGPRPRQWNAMVGIVTNNKDPKDWGRVKVKLPWMDSDAESWWARVAGVGGANERGLYVLPEINDEVLVLFEEGDVNRPLVVAGLWNGQDAPVRPIGEALKGSKVNQRIFQTRVGHYLLFQEEDHASIKVESAGGHVVLIDDDDKKIEITTTGGHKLVLDDQEKKIEAKTARGHQVLMDDQGFKIEIKTTMGNVITLNDQSNSITIKSLGNINVEAMMGMTLKANTSMSIQSMGTMSIQSTGPMTIKGLPVSIN